MHNFRPPPPITLGFLKQVNLKGGRAMFNFCVLSGEVCSKPDISFTEDGQAITSFYLSISRRKNIEVLSYKRLAEAVASSLNPGDRVVAAGTLLLHSWLVGEERWKSDPTLLAHSLAWIKGDHFVLE